MASLKIKFGKGELVLTKSKKYIGVKQSESRGLDSEHSFLATEVKKERHPSLGGFRVIEANKDKSQTLDDKLSFMRGLDEVEVGTHVYHAPGSDKPLVPTGSIYITFHAYFDEEQQENLLKTLSLSLKERRDEDRVVATVTAMSSNPIKCAMVLQKHAGVKWAEPDLDAELESYVFAAPTAKLLGQMWHLKNSGRIPDNPAIQIKPGADAKVMDAWKLLDGYGNPNLVVAVIDNGIDLAHPDLNSKVVKPWDFWRNSPTLTSGDPTYTHGTPCASVAIAPQNGGMCGSAPAARFMPLSGTGFSIESTEAMFRYVIEKGADIVSCSWGTVDSNFQLGPDKIAAIARAARNGRGGKGCVICFASGNEGVDYVNYYGAIPDVICVGASTSEDDHADYSNTGPELTIVAPSNGGFYPIVAARASWDNGDASGGNFYYGDDIDRGSRYQHFGGTSSATPLVAGICALILSANPNLTAREVKQILCQTADKIGSPSLYVNGFSRKFGYGRVNAAKAVAEALSRAGKLPAPPVNTGTVTPPKPPVTAAGEPPRAAGLYRFGSNVVLAKRGFGVQVGSYGQWASVKSLAPALESKFRQPTLFQVTTVNGALIYRLFVGQLATLGDANRLKAAMLAGSVQGVAKDLSTIG
jgi:subtilisin family serine protease